MESSVYVKISGLNLTRLIDRLISKSILIDDLQTKNRTIKFKIKEKDLPVLDDVCKIEHKYYVILQRNGIKQFFFKLPYFFGTILALVIVSCYFYSYSLFINNINISVESTQSYQISKVYKVLENYEIEVGMNKNLISTQELREQLLLELDDIEDCKVELNGVNLNIYIYPAVTKESTGSKTLVSKYNAIITFAEAYNGKLMVSVGDLVQIDDVLIESDTVAQGVVRGKVYFTGTIIFNENQQTIEKTGKTFVTRDYIILNIFSIKSKENCTFSNYLTENCDFYLNQGFGFPIKVTQTIYYETYIRNLFVPFESVEEEVKSQAYDLAYLQIDTEGEITNVTYSIVREDNIIRVDCFIEVECDLI